MLSILEETTTYQDVSEDENKSQIVPNNPAELFLQRTKEAVAAKLVDAVKDKMSDEEKLELGMDIASLEGLMFRRAERSLEPAAIPNDGISESQSELSSVDEMMGIITEIVADVYAERSGTVAGRTEEYFRKSKKHRKVGSWVLHGATGASVLSATIVGAPLAATAAASIGLSIVVPHIPALLASGLRVATGRVRDGINNKLNAITSEQTDKINKQIENEGGTEKEKIALRSLLIAKLLTEPLRSQLNELTTRTHLDPEAGAETSDYRKLAAEMSKTSSDFLLHFFGLSEIRTSVAQSEKTRLHTRLRAKLATVYHDAWRDEYIHDFDGESPSRNEHTTDREWALRHGSSTVDLLSTAFEELPKDWQIENTEAAESALKIISELGTNIDLNNPKKRNQVGKIVHNAWLQRQNNADDRSLNVPYEDLSPEEQEKDIRQIAIAISLVGQSE
jgi:hypothetical protein